MAALNYAEQYQQYLEQEFPYVLYFGALFAAPNNGRYKWVDSQTIKVPTITTTGRVDGDRDTIGTRKRNYNNAWTPLILSNRLWCIRRILTRPTRQPALRISLAFTTRNRSSLK